MGSNIVIKIENGLGFKLNRNKTKLLAVVQPSEDKIELTVDTIKARLKAAELADLFINEYSILELIRRYQDAPAEVFQLEIAERRDASCEITLSDDTMKAHLAVTPNFGGQAITLADVQTALQEKGVVFGVVPIDEIEAQLKKERVAHFLIAEGLAPVTGVDTKFLSLMPEIPVRKPLIDAEGVVDYRELGDVLTVHKDDVLIQRIPAIPGEKGQNVLGEELQPSGGLEIPFSSDQRGVYVNPQDSNQLLSAITGQPIIVPHGIIVSPILTVKNVNLTSGNIRFEGSVVVLGDVEIGMKVYALEDITIDGNVTNAQLECKGSLTVKGGVTGNSELIAGGNVSIKGGIQGTPPSKRQKKIVSTSKTESPTPKEYQTKIKSQGSVSVSFVENFNIEAGIDIVISKYSLNSKLTAVNKIVIGGKSGKKPSIIGGITWAMMLVKAAIIGSNSGIKTHVQAGSNPYIQRRYTELKDILIESNEKQKDVHKILAWMADNSKKSDPEMLARLHHTLSKLVIDTEAYHAELNELVLNMTVIDGAKIIGERGVYTGTEIKINKAVWKADENRGKSVFTELKRKIIVNTR
ncbi:MAG: FapA family protein [Methylococcaceae bacterium]